MTHYDPAPSPSHPAQEDPHAGPFGERGTRMLKWAVIIMAIMLVVGFIAIIFIIAFRAVQLGDQETGAGGGGAMVQAPHGFARLDVEIEPDTLVSQIVLDGDRMAIHVTHNAADEIILIDMRTGELLGRVRLVEPEGEPAQ